MQWSYLTGFYETQERSDFGAFPGDALNVTQLQYSTARFYPILSSFRLIGKGLLCPEHFIIANPDLYSLNSYLQFVSLFFHRHNIAFFFHLWYFLIQDGEGTLHVLSTQGRGRCHDVIIKHISIHLNV